METFDLQELLILCSIIRQTNLNLDIKRETEPITKYFERELSMFLAEY